MGAKKQKKKAPEENTERRFRMRTSIDVIHRCQHDENIDEREVMIGYWDRILNAILEKPLTAFSSWGTIEMAARDELAIPQHRIEYLKYRAEKIWDRATKLDLVFGSTPPFTKISFHQDYQTMVPRMLQEPQARTPLQELAHLKSIVDFNDLKRLLSGPGFGCKVKTATFGNETGRVFSVMYDDQRYFVKQTQDISLEARALNHCRGCIYEQAYPFTLVCAAFDKFWEVEDHRAADVHFEDQDLIVTEKADGLLTKMYYYKKEWRIASNSMPSAFTAAFHWGNDAAVEEESTIRTETTVGSLFMEAVEASVDGGFAALCKTLRTDRCYAFELLHPRAQIVVPHDTPQIVHLLTRQLPDGSQIAEDSELDHLISRTRVLPRSLYARDHGCTKRTLLDIARHLPAYCEGFVAQDSCGRRVKIKGRMYLLAHRSPERLGQRGFFALSGVLENPLVCWKHRAHLRDQALVKQYLPQILNRLADESEALTVVDLMQSLTADVGGALRLRLENFLDMEIKATTSSSDTLDKVAVHTLSRAHQPNERLDPRRPNYFVSIKIDSPTIIKQVQELQQALVDFDPQLRASLQPLKSLHLTLATARVNLQQLKRLEEVLARVAPDLLSEYLSVGANAIPITFQGVDSFRVRGQVVFICPEPQGRLTGLMNALYDAIESAGILAAGRKAQNRPHVTVAKLSRALSRSIGFFDESAWRCRGFGPHTTFGVQHVSALHLSSMGLNLGAAPTGFYETPASYIRSVRASTAISSSEAAERLINIALENVPLLVIMRGLPGSGKSTLSKMIDQRAQLRGLASFVCSADTYFERCGHFDCSLLGQAHDECKIAVRNALLSRRKNIIIVDNTNCSFAEVASYLNLATTTNAEARIALVEFECSSLAEARRFAQRGVHNAPAESAWRRWEIVPLQDHWTHLLVTSAPNYDLYLALNDLAASRSLRYLGIFLTEASRQKLVRLCPPTHAVVKAHHATIAYAPEVGSIQLRAAAERLGSKVKLRIGNPVTNANAQAVLCVDVAQQWHGHLTISHSIGSRPIDARELQFNDVPLNEECELEGIIGIHTSVDELSSPSAVIEVARRLKKNRRLPSRQECPIILAEASENWTEAKKVYVWDFDHTLIETAECASRRDQFARLPSPDDPASLDRQSTPLPALALLQEISKSANESSAHVLITGRVAKCEDAVKRLLARYRALELFDVSIFKPDAWRGRSSDYKASALECVLGKMPNVQDIIVYDDDATSRESYIAVSSMHSSAGKSISVHDPAIIPMSNPPLVNWLACFGLGIRSKALTENGLDAFSLLKAHVHGEAELKVVGSWARGRCSDIDALCFGPKNAICFLERLASRLSSDKKHIIDTYLGRSPRRAVLSFRMSSGVEVDVSVADEYDSKRRVFDEADAITLCALDALSIALAARGIGSAPWLHSLRTHELIASIDSFRLGLENASCIAPAALAASFARAVSEKKIPVPGKQGKGVSTLREERTRSAFRDIAQIMATARWPQHKASLDALARASPFPPMTAKVLVRFMVPKQKGISDYISYKETWARVSSASARLFQCPGILVVPKPPELMTAHQKSFEFAVCGGGIHSPQQVSDLLKDPLAEVLEL